MSEVQIHGSCLCGSVAFEVRSEPGVYRYCFCSLCRKNRGTRYAANVLVEPDNFRWLKGENLLGRFDLAGSRFGNCFCTQCGTPMPRHTLSGKSVVIPVGVLDGDPDLKPDHVVFWDSRVEWLPEDASLQKYSEFAD